MHLPGPSGSSKYGVVARSTSRVRQPRSEHAQGRAMNCWRCALMRRRLVEATEAPHSSTHGSTSPVAFGTSMCIHQQALWNSDRQSNFLLAFYWSRSCVVSRDTRTTRQRLGVQPKPRASLKRGLPCRSRSPPASGRYRHRTAVLGDFAVWLLLGRNQSFAQAKTSVRMEADIGEANAALITTLVPIILLRW
jgi:hypothetical protein